MITVGISEAHHNKIIRRLTNEVRRTKQMLSVAAVDSVTGFSVTGWFVITESGYSEPAVSPQIPRCLQSHHGAPRYR